MRILQSLCALVVLSSFALSAQAVTITTADRINNGYGINFTYNGILATTSYAGPFATTVVGTGFQPASFDSYCVDLTHFLQATETVTPLNINTALTNGPQLAYLYNTYASTVGNDKTKGAALQIAIWETEYDYGSVNGINLSNGTFKFNSVSGDTQNSSGHFPIYDQVSAQANTYLGTLPASYSGTATYLLAEHVGNNGQSLIGPAAVPEPGVVSLMVSGMIGCSVFAFRKRRK